MLVGDDAFERIENDLAIDEHATRSHVLARVSRSCVTMTIVSCSVSAEVQHELVERRAAIGVEARRRLVEEQDRRVERQRAGERNALTMPPESCAGNFAAVSSDRPTIRSLSSTRRDSAAASTSIASTIGSRCYRPP